jgi:tRNA modification GTPase
MTGIRAEDDVLPKDTICAISTPPGVGGIAVIRVSGPEAVPIARKICPFLPEEPETHRVYYGISRTMDGAHQLDEVLTTYFKEGRSFTAEPTVEISCHGGSIVTGNHLKELIQAGCRLAKPGEFTYRAFMNGRLDLVQAESVLQLIESQSVQSARLSLRQLQGHLSVEFGRIEDDLLWILAQLEASIDFSAEGIEVISPSKLIERSRSLMDFVASMIASYQRGRFLKEGLQVALIGKPNAGKSSLLNAFLREDKAIVTSIAGTTRDLVEGKYSINGVPVTFVDTAGIRETENEIEQIGIERSRRAIRGSDLNLVVIDLSVSDWKNDLQDLMTEAGPKSWILLNKADLDQSSEWRSTSEVELEKRGWLNQAFWVSAVKRTGLDQVEKKLVEVIGDSDVETSSVVTQARHLEQLQKIQSCLSTAIGLMSKDSSPEFIAFELQEAIRAIHELLGKEFHEQVIDRIFKEFCLGK